MSQDKVELLDLTKDEIRNQRAHQLVLFNDDVTPIDVVVEAMITVCRMTAELAIKTTIEAHQNGRTVAHVGDKDECVCMKNQLQNEYQLTVEVEPI